MLPPKSFDLSSKSLIIRMKQAARKTISKKHPNISGSKRTREIVVDVPLTTTLKKEKKVTFIDQVLHTLEKTGQSSTVSTNPNDESCISKRVKHPRLYKKSCCRMLIVAVPTSTFCDIFDKFTNQQRELVKEIGFGGLLMMQLKRIGRKMNSWLIEGFNTESKMFVIGDLKEFVMSSNVIHDILALPRNEGNKVPKYPIYRKSDNDFSPAKDWWTWYIGVSTPSEGLTTSDVVAKLSSIKDANDEFVKLFVLAAVSLFLAPISNKRVDLKIVKALDSVEAIKSYDWCTFVLDKLCDGVKHCQKNVRNKHLSGCITDLQIAYIHHLEFRGVTAPTKIPLIQHWTTEQIVERVRLELRSGGFENGILVWDKYPICRERRCLNHLLSSSSNIHAVSKDRKELMKFLAKKHLLSKVLAKCNFLEFSLPWQSKKSDNDCGVYLMKHMECFYGEKFDCRLDKALQGRIFRAEICGQIMLSDSNANLHVLKQKLTYFDKLKPNILKDMKNAEHIAAVKKGKAKQDASS